MPSLSGETDSQGSESLWLQAVVELQGCTCPTPGIQLSPVLCPTQFNSKSHRSQCPQGRAPWRPCPIHSIKTWFMVAVFSNKIASETTLQQHRHGTRNNIPSTPNHTFFSSDSILNRSIHGCLQSSDVHTNQQALICYTEVNDLYESRNLGTSVLLANSLQGPTSPKVLFRGRATQNAERW